MSIIDLVDPELRDALTQWPQVPLSAETLMRRRADALALLSSVPTPDLPDIATGEIHVESAFGAKPHSRAGIMALITSPTRFNRSSLAWCESPWKMQTWLTRWPESSLSATVMLPQQS